MIIRFASAILILSTFSSSILAENWKAISGTDVTYDADSLTKNGDVVRVNERVSLFLREGRPPQIMHSTIEADCKKLTSRTVWFRLQREDGSYDTPDTVPSPWKDFRGHKGFHDRVTTVYCKRSYMFWK